MNFQYIECLDVEFMNFNFEIKEAVLNLNESSAKKSSSYEGKVLEVKTSS